MKSPRYDWSLVSPETAQKVLQAAHDFETAVNAATGQAITKAVEQARKEAAIYEITADEQKVLCTAQAYYRANRHRVTQYIGELTLGTRMDIEDGCLRAFMEACEKAASK